MGMHIRCLVTFVPRNPVFLAHPQPFMEEPALAIGLPHIQLCITEPLEESYDAAIRSLQIDGIDTLVTGDIAEVTGHSNWIGECSQRLGMRLARPLWRRERADLLKQMLALRFHGVFSCVKTLWIAENWLGREFNGDSVAELHALHRRNGLDLCGENGEYHTLVTDAPLFQKRIRIVKWTRQSNASLAYMLIRQTELVTK